MLALSNYLERGISHVDGWLYPTTATMIASLLLLQTDQGTTADVCEIGVHHGRLFLILANATQPGEKAVAVDVFSEQEKNLDQSGYGDRDVFERHLATYAPGAAVDVIQSSSLELDRFAFLDRRFRFVSIDGGHTAAVTLNDLTLAERTLIPEGLVALDDAMNTHWTGVLSGLVQYLHQGGTLVPFAIVPNKLFLAKNKESAGRWGQQLRRLFSLAYAKDELEFLGSRVLCFDEHPYYNREGAADLRNQRDDLERERDALQRKLDGLTREQDEARRNRENPPPARDEFALECDALRRDRDATASQLDAMRASTSWRVTAPLRAIAGLAKRG